MKILILGTGKMGSWLASTLAAENEIAAFDLDFASLSSLENVKVLPSLGAVSEFAPRMFLNCVPLGKTVETFQSVLALLPPSCLLADIASVKTGLADFYAVAGHPFVSTHPMFGPTYVKPGNLAGQNAVIIAESCKEGKEFFINLYGALGLRVFEESFEGHDRTVAYSLSTPFASTMVFSACMKGLDAPGTNFKKHLDIARGLLAEDDSLISEIMFNPHTVRQLELINSQMAYLTHIVKDRDHEEMGKFLGKLRRNLIGMS